MQKEALERIRSGFLNWLGFVWLARYWNLRKRGNSALWRRESKLFAGFFFGGILFWLLWLQLAFKYDSLDLNVGSFFFIYVATALVMNYVSYRRWRPPNFAKYLTSSKRLSSAIAPDQMNGMFAFAWCEAHEFIFYGYRTPKWENHIAPHHLALFGETSGTQNDFVARCVGHALQNSPTVYRRLYPKFWKKKRMGGGTCNFVVIGFDVESGGIDFRAFHDCRGVRVVDEGLTEVASVISFVAALITDRANRIPSYGDTQILLVAEGYVADAFFGRLKSLGYINDAIQTILRHGKDFGVHLVCSAEPLSAAETLKAEVRHYFMQLTYFTRAKYRATVNGKTVMANAKGPEFFVDVAHVYYNGQLHNSKIVYERPQAIGARVQKVVLTKHADALYQRLLNKDYPVVSPRKEKEPEKTEESEVPESSWRKGSSEVIINGIV